MTEIKLNSGAANLSYTVKGLIALQKHFKCSFDQLPATLAASLDIENIAAFLAHGVTQDIPDMLEEMLPNKLFDYVSAISAELSALFPQAEKDEKKAKATSRK